MVAEITTSAQITEPVDATFQRTYLEVAKANCPYFAGTTPAEISSNNGNNFKARWRRYDNFDPVAIKDNPLTELTGALSYPTRQPLRASITTLETTLQKYGMYISTTEEVDLTQFNGHTASLAKSIGVCAGRVLNMLQRDEEEDNSTQYFAGVATDVDEVVTYLKSDDVEYAINWLERNDAMSFFGLLTGSDAYETRPINKTYLAITHPDVIADARAMSNWVSVEKYAGQTSVYAGEKGTTDRLRWIDTSDSSYTADGGGAAAAAGRPDAAAGARALRSTTGTAADVYNVVIYGENAFGSVGLDVNHIKTTYKAGDTVPGILMINLPRGYDKTDPFGELQMMGFKTWHAAKVLSEVDAGSNTKWCLNMRVGATALS